MSSGDKIVLTEEQFQAAIAAAIHAATPQKEAPESVGATISRIIEQVRPPGDPGTIVPCQSPNRPNAEMPGSTFDARIVRNTIVELLNYRAPECADAHISNGGCAPMPKFNGLLLNKDWQSWHYQNFWRADLRDYVGKPASVLEGRPIAKG